MNIKDNIIYCVLREQYHNLCWQCEQYRTFKYNSKNFGSHYAELCRDAEKSIRLHYSQSEIRSALKAKDDYVLAYIEEKCTDAIKAMKSASQSASQPVSQPVVTNDKRRIWVFWWTGEHDAPDIVKACIKSIRQNANGHEVILIDKDNIADYVSFPQYIEIKHNSGAISHAHYSDIVRLSLLAEYGGVWIDATVFISQPLPKYVFETDFFSAKSVDVNAHYYSHSRWTTYFLAGHSGFPLFRFVRNMLYEYWANANVAIDYLLFDYMIGLVYNCSSKVRTVIDLLPDNNLIRGKLMSEIEKQTPYSEELFDELRTGETFLSKLSWRYGNPVAYVNGKLTNYGYLLSL